MLSKRKESSVNLNVDGKVVLITGASHGIGAALAEKFSLEGALVIINYYKSTSDEVQQILTRCAEFNTKVFTVKADVRDLHQVQEMHRLIYRKFGKIDVLINNAGVCQDSLIQTMREDIWDDVIDTNLKGCFICCKEISKTMIKQKYGKIINIASLKGIIGSLGQVNYCASKAGMIGLTKALAKELGGWNISVNALCPGFIITDLNKHDSYKQERAISQSVLKNASSSLSDLIHFTLLMASDSISGISGQVFNLDSRIN